MLLAHNKCLSQTYGAVAFTVLLTSSAVFAQAKTEAAAVEQAQATPQKTAQDPVPTAPTADATPASIEGTAGAVSAGTSKPAESSAMVDPLAAIEPPQPVYLAPKQARFQVISIHLSTPLDGRRLSPQRLLTLAVKGDGQIMESFWERKRLSLYREVVIPSPVEGVPAGLRYEQIGFARIESVMGNVVQAKIETDGLIKRTTDPADAMVVMIGDSAKLFVEPEAAPKPKRRRKAKPKPKSPFVREEMKWRL